MTTRRLAAGCIASLGWAALWLQLYLTVELAKAHEVSIATAVISYFSFFTILTNLLVALCLTLVACEQHDESLWNKPATQTSLALYILVVAIVYAAVLQGLWTPSGLEYITDRMFHAVLPLLYVIFWLLLTPKGSLRLIDQISWQAYPLTYLFYTLARGALIGAYPYPFLNVAQEGYAGVLLNSFYLLVLFLILGTLLIIVDWLLGSLQTRWQSQIPAP
jgi:hypothetical protein